MFDPRMMAPDGSSYSRGNILAAPSLAATSAMTPPGVQTISGPAPVQVGGNSGSGVMGQPRQGLNVLANLDRFQGRPWYDNFMAAHPNFQNQMPQQGQWSDPGFRQQHMDQRAAYQGQLGDWRAQNPMLGGGGQMRDWWSSRPQYSALQGF